MNDNLQNLLKKISSLFFFLKSEPVVQIIFFLKSTKLFIK